MCNPRVDDKCNFVKLGMISIYAHPQEKRDILVAGEISGLEHYFLGRHIQTDREFAFFQTRDYWQ
jgi:hypothetical protein